CGLAGRCRRGAPQRSATPSGGHDEAVATNAHSARARSALMRHCLVVVLLLAACGKTPAPKEAEPAAATARPVAPEVSELPGNIYRRAYVAAQAEVTLDNARQ